jgi:hypothetical protein
MAQLVGDTRTIDLGGGFRIVAPGLKGTATVLGPRAPGTRGPQDAKQALDDAFAATDVQEVADVELQVSEQALPPNSKPMRGPEGTDAFEFMAPDPGPDKAQVVLSLDEAGAMRWHFPLNDDNTIQPPSVRGPGNMKVYRIPKAVGTPPPAAAGTERGLMGAIGKKLLKVLVYPVTDRILGPLTEFAVGKWEKAKRPYALRRYLPGDQAELVPGDWAKLTAGRSLLLVHGTFSTAKSAFAALEGDTLKALAGKYQDRVFAFDHPSLSASPVDNAKWFFSQLPAGHNLDVDIVCHSRGGLVSRCISGWAHKFTQDPDRFKVGKLVLVGVPNQGTLLAKADHMVEFLDRMTTALNVFPDFFITDILEGILTVVKVVGHAGAKALDGLAAMNPGNEFLTSLADANLSRTRIFAVGGDFEPKTAGLSAAFCLAGEALVDRIFKDQPNDLVVPTAGMSAWNGHNIDPANFLSFAPGSGILHTNYFRHKDTAARLLAWL